MAGPRHANGTWQSQYQDFDRRRFRSARFLGWPLVATCAFTRFMRAGSAFWPLFARLANPLLLTCSDLGCYGTGTRALSSSNQWRTKGRIAFGSSDPTKLRGRRYQQWKDSIIS